MDLGAEKGEFQEFTEGSGGCVQGQWQRGDCGAGRWLHPQVLTNTFQDLVVMVLASSGEFKLPLTPGNISRLRRSAFTWTMKGVPTVLAEELCALQKGPSVSGGLPLHWLCQDYWGSCGPFCTKRGTGDHGREIPDPRCTRQMVLSKSILKAQSTSLHLCALRHHPKHRTHCPRCAGCKGGNE